MVGGKYQVVRLQVSTLIDLDLDDENRINFGAGFLLATHFYYGMEAAFLKVRS